MSISHRKARRRRLASVRAEEAAQAFPLCNCNDKDDAELVEELHDSKHAEEIDIVKLAACAKCEGLPQQSSLEPKWLRMRPQANLR